MAQVCVIWARIPDFQVRKMDATETSNESKCASSSVLYFSIKIQSITKNDVCFLLFSVFPLLDYSKISER